MNIIKGGFVYYLTQFHNEDCIQKYRMPIEKEMSYQKNKSYLEKFSEAGTFNNINNQVKNLNVTETLTKISLELEKLHLTEIK